MTTKTMKIGKIDWTDSLTPRMFSSVRTTIPAISTPTFARWTGSSQVEMSPGATRSAASPKKLRGTMLKIASPPEAIEVVIVRT